MFTNDAGYLTSYTDTNDIDYINAASFNTSDGVITGTGVGNAGFTVDIDGRYLLRTTDTFTGALTINGYIKGNGQELILSAGESHSFATGQTNELVYINAESGLQINSSPDNWASGWAGRKTTTINDTSGNSTFAGALFWSGGGSAESNAAYDNMITAASVTGTATKTLTLTQQDGGTVTTSWTDTNTDTNDIDYVDSGSFDVGTGDLTLSGVGNAGATVNLDGRYLTAHPNITAASSSNNSGRTYIQDITLDSNGHVTGIATASESVTNTTYTLSVGTGGSNSANINLNPSTGGTTNVQLSGGSNITISENTTTDVITITAANTNYYVDGLSFDTGTGILTASVNGATDQTVDLDGRYQLAGTYNTVIGTDSDINTSGATVIYQLNMTDGVIQSHSTRTLTAADLGISQPNPPTLTALNIIGETIEVVFDESTTNGVDKYEVWSSVAGGSFGLIANIPTEDIAPTMTAVDAAFSVSGSQEYRIYAIKNGVYSASATGATTFNTPSLSVVNMSVINLNPAYYIQYDLPDSRFIDHIEIYMDAETTSSSLSRTGASLIYSGSNSSYMYQIGASDLDKFHQFWVEVVAS